MGMASANSILLVDSFRYIPPQSNEEQCHIYKYESTTTKTTVPAVSTTLQTKVDSISTVNIDFTTKYRSTTIKLDTESSIGVKTTFDDNFTDDSKTSITSTLSTELDQNPTTTSPSVNLPITTENYITTILVPTNAIILEETTETINTGIFSTTQHIHETESIKSTATYTESPIAVDTTILEALTTKSVEKNNQTDGITVVTDSTYLTDSSTDFNEYTSKETLPGIVLSTNKPTTILTHTTNNFVKTTSDIVLSTSTYAENDTEYFTKSTPLEEKNTVGTITDFYSESTTDIYYTITNLPPDTSNEIPLDNTTLTHSYPTPTIPTETVTSNNIYTKSTIFSDTTYDVTLPLATETITTSTYAPEFSSSIYPTTIIPNNSTTTAQILQTTENHIK